MDKINITPKYKTAAVEDLKLYEKNAKKHPAKQVKQLADIIREVGFKVPVIVDKNNVIISGHGRVMAAKRLGLEVVPVIVADDLNQKQVRAFRLADNKIAESGVNKKLILEELEDLRMEGYDIKLTGYDEGFLDQDKKVEAEVEFTAELLEENNYVVFAFDNSIDWNVVEDYFGLKTVQASDSKKDYRRLGVGRVIKGDALLKLIE